LRLVTRRVAWALACGRGHIRSRGSRIGRALACPKFVREGDPSNAVHCLLSGQKGWKMARERWPWALPLVLALFVAPRVVEGGLHSNGTKRGDPRDLSARLRGKNSDQGFGSFIGLSSASGSLQTVISLSREVQGEGTYAQGEDLEISVVLTRQGASTVNVLGMEERLPSGWSFQAVAGEDAPQIGPATSFLEFFWFPVPVFPVEFQYTVSVPSGEVGPKEIQGEAIYRIADLPGEELRSEFLVTVIEPRSPSRTFYVDATAAPGGAGSSDMAFTTLSEALADTESFRGDVIIARPGTYAGNVEVPAFARLLGEDGAFHTQINSVDNTADVVTLNEGAILRGFRVGGASTAAGVRILAGDFTAIGAYIVPRSIQVVELTRRIARVSTR